MTPVRSRLAVLVSTVAMAVAVTTVPANAAPDRAVSGSPSPRASSHDDATHADRQSPTTSRRGHRVQVGYVVDGDTIRLADGRYVRLIGIDTPERGRPYYRAATRYLDGMVGARVRLVNPSSVDDQDRYGRLLRYLRVGHHRRDAGLAQIRKGYAHARYDGRDGYDRHPMQATYRRTDAHTRDLW